MTRCGAASFAGARTNRLRAQLGKPLCWSPSYRGVFGLWLGGWGLPLPRADFPVVQVPLKYRGIDIVTRRFVRAAHKRGVQVQVWTVNDAAEMRRLLDLGVDGIMTDRPSVLKDVLIARGEWRD
jgi:glycerophosphoryl diester phosphodiesterase